MTLTVTFLTAKSNNNYGQVVAIRHLVQGYTDYAGSGRYSIIVGVGSGRTTTGMSVVIETWLPVSTVT